MKVKIVSDGTWFGTTVIDTETGKVLENVTAIEWSIRPARPPQVRLEIASVEGEIRIVA